MPTLSAPRRLRIAGFSLVELLVVVAIFGLVFFPLIITYGSHRTSQALSSNAEQVANYVRAAHIFSREAQKEREWGIRSKSDSAYTLYSTGSSGIVEVQNYTLDNGVTFESGFDILFEIGTGRAKTRKTIKLQGSNGKRIWVEVSDSGLIEVKVDP